MYDNVEILASLFKEASFIEPPPKIVSQIIKNCRYSINGFKKIIAIHLANYHKDDNNLDWDKINDFLSIPATTTVIDGNYGFEFDIKKEFKDWYFLPEIEKDINKYNYPNKNPIEALKNVLKNKKYKLHCVYGKESTGSGSFDEDSSVLLIKPSFPKELLLQNLQDKKSITFFNNFDFDNDSELYNETYKSIYHECIHMSQSIMFFWKHYIRNYKTENYVPTNHVGLPDFKDWIKNKYIDQWGRILPDAPDFIKSLQEKVPQKNEKDEKEKQEPFILHELRPIEFYTLLSDVISDFKNQVKKFNISQDKMNEIIKIFIKHNQTLKMLESIPQAKDLYLSFVKKLTKHIIKHKDEIFNN